MTQSVDLTIIATSVGANGLPTSKEQMVTVDIHNVNDNAPVFADAGTFMLSEGADGSTNPIAVGSVSATDADGDEVSYSVKGDPAGWSIDANGALSYTGTGLDFGDGASVTLTIVATSTGTDGMMDSAEQEIMVTVEDRNNAMFTTDFAAATFSIDENASGVDVGDPIAAMDPDEGEEVTLSVKDNADWEITADGQLRYVGAGLDYEAGTSVDLTIVATSMGTDGTPTGVEQDITVMVNNVEEVGHTFTLTDKEDRFTGGEDSDTFRAPSGTLTDLDDLDGGGGVGDKIDVSYIGNDVNFSPRVILVDNIEILDVRTTGDFGRAVAETNNSETYQLDFSSWDLDQINMVLIGDGEDETGDGPGNVNIKAGGAGVTGANLVGQVDIMDAGTVDLDGVAADKAVNITGNMTTRANVKGGAAVTITSDPLAEATVDGANGDVAITSKAITNVTLANIDGDGQGTAHTVTVTNGEAADKAPAELTVTVDKVNNTNAAADPVTVGPATVALAGTGAAKTVNVVASGMASNVTLTSAAATALNFSGDADLTFVLPVAVEDITATNEGALTIAAITATVESFDGAGATGAINLGAAGALTGDAAGEFTSITTGSGGDKLYINAGAKLATINSDGGADTIVVQANSLLANVNAGEGDDTVELTAGGTLRDVASNGGGLAIDLGGGDDTYVASNAGNAQTTVMGGVGDDTLQMDTGSNSGTTNAAGMSIYSGFEVLDVTGGSGTYNMELLGLRRVVSKATSAEVILDNTAAGTTVRVDGVGDETGGTATTDATIIYNLKNATGNSDRVEVTVAANGAKADTIDNDPDTAGNQMVQTGQANLTFTANGVETVVINSDVNVHAESDAMASQYQNIVALTSDATKTLDINGEGRVSVTTTATTVTRVDATGNSGGVSVDVNASTGAVDFDGGAGNDAFTGGAGGDDFTGGAGDDTLTGNAGADTLRGGAGDDTILGGAGIDVILGGVGADTLTGGEDRDIFRFQHSSDSRVSFDEDGMTQGIDTITDFQTSQSDVIRLSRSLATESDLAGGTNAVLVKGPIVDDADATTNNLQVYLTANASGFFRQGLQGDNLKIATAIAENGTDMYVFIDANNNGNFEAGSDLVILLTGVTSVTGDDFDIIG